jgi:glycosyltransferase involved in cell wall biosynthesis
MNTIVENRKPFIIQNAAEVSPQNIRVLIIITQLVMGGGTKVALDIAQHLKNKPNYEVEILTGPIAEGYVDVTHLAHEKGLPTIHVKSLVNQINPIANLKAVSEIRSLILQGNYDIVHTHTKVAGVVGRIAARTAKTPIIVHHVHGWGSPEEMAAGKRLLYLWMERLCARFTHRIITVSKLDMEKGLANRIARKEKFSVIYNGIELGAYRQSVDAQKLRSELGLDPKSKVVGMIGRLNQQKNPLDFIRAAAIVAKGFSDVQFVIIGDGSLLPQCQQLINELELSDKFFLLGYRKDVAKILSILTLTAMSSLWEGLPIVFLESMSAGKPIVANDVDGAREVVTDWETGFLVKPHQPREMAERILYLLNDEEACCNMGKMAQLRSNYFSMERMLDQVESIYQDLHSYSRSYHHA